MSPADRDNYRPRAWSVYDRDGARLDDVVVSRQMIRETMPDAWVDVDGGRIVVGLQAGELPGFIHSDPIAARVPAGERGHGFDPE